MTSNVYQYPINVPLSCANRRAGFFIYIWNMERIRDFLRLLSVPELHCHSVTSLFLSTHVPQKNTAYNTATTEIAQK